MSVFVEGNGNLYGFSNAIRQNYYMSNYYALVNDDVFVEFKNPINANLNLSFYLSGYLINYGDGDAFFFSNTDKNVHKYTTEGTYFISYSAVYVDVFVDQTQINKIQESFNNINQIIGNILNVPITKKSAKIWPNIVIFSHVQPKFYYILQVQQVPMP